MKVDMSSKTKKPNSEILLRLLNWPKTKVVLQSIEANPVSNPVQYGSSPSQPWQKLFQLPNCPVSWGCRIHRLHLCRGVNPPPNECPECDTKPFDGEAPVTQELWGMRSIVIAPRSTLAQSGST